MVDKWQLIQTAPKAEGVSVLLGWAGANPHTTMGFWSGSYHGVHAWCDEHYENAFSPQPTHWMALPVPPALDGENGGQAYLSSYPTPDERAVENAAASIRMAAPGDIYISREDALLLARVALACEQKP